VPYLVWSPAADGPTICIAEHNMDLVRVLADRACFLARRTYLPPWSWRTASSFPSTGSW